MKKNQYDESGYDRERIQQLETFRELRQFIIDICYDYQCKDGEACQAQVGLGAIRVLCKGRQTEEEFKKVWKKWREEHTPQTPSQSGVARGWGEDNLGNETRR